jgi:hypothetical protein
MISALSIPSGTGIPGSVRDVIGRRLDHDDSLMLSSSVSGNMDKHEDLSRLREN